MGSNYSTLIRGAIRDFQFIFPESTFGEALYSFLRLIPSNKDIKPALAEIRKLSDKEIYNAIEKAIKVEAEDEPTTEE